MNSTKTNSKTHLINTAYRLFLSKSYNSTSTSLICDEASINKGTFYHFFPSKAALLIACLELHADILAGQMTEISGQDISAIEKIEKLKEIPREIAASSMSESGKVEGCLLGNIALELSTIDDQIHAAITHCAYKVIKAIQLTLEHYKTENNIAMDTASAAEVMFSMMQGGILLSKLENNPEKVVTVLKTLPEALKTYQ